MYDEHTPVLIVGGGLTGLSAATFLAWHGVPCLLVERHPDALIHPRARGFNPRTTELYRQVGLEATIKEAASTVADWSKPRMLMARTLAGPEMFAMTDAGEGDALAEHSPAAFANIDQDRLELILRDHARSLGADVRFATELTSFDEDGDGVTATLTDLVTDHVYTVRARYLVAGDGPGSQVRERLGIPADGPGEVVRTVTMVFEGDLSPALRDREINICYLERPEQGTIVMRHDANHRWVFGTPYHPERGESLADFTEERCVELIREAVGLPDLDVELKPQIPVTGTKVLAFPLGAQVARRFRAGRVFLAGDAAHTVPPTGGFGANTCIQDAHNLAWKLAAVLDGRAAPELLDTYETERRPVAELTLGEAHARWESRTGGGGQESDYSAVVYGYQYRSSAVPGAPAGDDVPPALPANELAGQVGTRAPHVWLERDGTGLSTIDLFGHGFVVLTGPEGRAWHEAAAKAVARFGTRVDAYAVGTDLADPAGRFARLYGLGANGAVLVRPDGFVAWRSDGGAEPSEAALTEVLGHLLHRDPTAIRT